MDNTTKTNHRIELKEHSVLQYLLWFATSASIFFGLMALSLRVIDVAVQEYLNARVFKESKEVNYRLSRSIGDDSFVYTVRTNPYTTWLLREQRESISTQFGKIIFEDVKFVLNPIASVLPLVLALSVGLSLLLSSCLPTSIGLFSQKIEREIVTALDELSVRKTGAHADKEVARLSEELTRADLRRLHDLAAGLDTSYDDLRQLQRALNWRESGFSGKVINVLGGLGFYLRRHFTIKYSNAILGMVYVGAAMLIIIIGIRGLKFIPSSKPSIILFALGLEFVLLITYAITLMYSPPEEAVKDHEPRDVSMAEYLNYETPEQKTEKKLSALLKVFLARGDG